MFEQELVCLFLKLFQDAKKSLFSRFINNIFIWVLIRIKRFRETIFTFLLDALILCLAWFLFYTTETELLSRFIETSEFTFLTLGSLHVAFWLVVNAGMGLYKKLYLISRFDEFLKVVKATVTGTLILYFISTIDARLDFQDAINTTALYFFYVGFCLSVNRFVIRSVQRMYAIRGKGLHRAVIVGTGKSARTAYEDLNRNKTLGMQVLGFIHLNGEDSDKQIDVDVNEVLGDLSQIKEIINTLEIQEVIVALEPERRDDLVKVISEADYPDISLKLLPDFFQLVNGLNKTNQIFGLPLIDVSPSPLSLHEKFLKRLFDIFVSLVVLILAAPLMLGIAVAIKITSEGPAVYQQKRVGRNGRVFTMYKFRTMVNNAEAVSGPTWASDDDPRITKIGHWLRKLRLDELPQFINVLKGDMSLVGPRPERPHFVEQFKNQVPLYTRRLRVQPGITGWAQVKWKYDSSLDDVKEKTKYDLFYVENMSLRMDFKILFNTVFTVIRAKGK